MPRSMKAKKIWVQEEDTLNSARRCQGRLTAGDNVPVVL